MKLKLVIAAVVAMSGVLTLSATTYYIKDGTTDWTDKANFCYDEALSQAASEAPQNGDEVALPKGVTAYVDTDESFALVKNLKNIKSCAGNLTATTTLIFDVDGIDKTNTLGCTLYSGIGYRGRVIKRGTGALAFETTVQRIRETSSGSTGNNWTCYGWACCKLDVEGGAFVFPRNPDPDSKSGGQAGSDTSLPYYMRVNHCDVTIKEGAKVDLMRVTGDSWNNFNTINGAGELTCEPNTAKGVGRGEIRVGSGGVDAGTFSGKMTSVIHSFNPGMWTLTGTESTTPMTYRFMYGYGSWKKAVTSVKSIGLSKQPSSVGAGTTIQADVYGGVLRYIGEGEYANKEFYASLGSYYADSFAGLDGGPNGGLYYDGQIGHGGTKSVMIGLGGENTEPCVFSGTIGSMNSEKNDLGQTYYYGVNFFKEGTGTWRFADRTNNVSAMYDQWKNHANIQGAYKVKEGTLQFDSVARLGEPSVLGTGLSRFEPFTGKTQLVSAVDYNFMLGWTNKYGSAGTEGTLEYTGTNAMDATTRPIKIFGNARLTANSDYRSRYRFLAPLNNGQKTLRLDGTSLADNEVFDITDTQISPISVVKTGSGKWILGGDQSFHGDLVVTGGTLVVSNPDKQYTWYRMTIKKAQDPVSSSTWGQYNLALTFLGFYDQGNNLITTNIKDAEGYRAAAIEPGECGFDAVRTFGNGSVTASTDNFRYYPSYAFDTTYPVESSRSDFTMRVLSLSQYTLNTSTALSFDLNNEQTYLPIVVRFPKGAAKCASFDWSTMFGSTQEGAGFPGNPKIYSVEGSVDGCHWEDANPDGGDFTVTVADNPGLKYKRYFAYAGVEVNFLNDEESYDGIWKHIGGKSLKGESTTEYSVLKNVRSVVVGNRATLKCEGETLKPLAAISVIGVENEIDGFDFVESGVMSISGINKDSPTVRLAKITNSATRDNLKNWALNIDGFASASRRIVIDDEGNVFLARGGCVFIYR